MTDVAEARRRITAARRKVDRARAAEATALLKLGRALAQAPRQAVGSRGGTASLSVDALAQLAGVTTRQAVYDLIRRAQDAEGPELTFRTTKSKGQKGGAS